MDTVTLIMTIDNTPSRRPRALAGWVLLCFAAALLGRLFGPGEWYGALNKAALNFNLWRLNP